MISAYIQAAMRKAHYELLPDDKLYYGEIPELIGYMQPDNNLKIAVRNFRWFLKTGFF